MGLEEEVAVLIHDMRNAAQALRGNLSELRSCRCTDKDLTAEMEMAVNRLAEAFPDLIDLLFNDDGSFRR